MTSSTPLAARWQVRLFALSVLALTVSGLGQMPLFKRYAISDIPGLAWTADFYIQHVLHYLGATVFLFLVLMWATVFVRRHMHSHVLTVWGRLRVAAVILLIGTGFFRVLKNLPSWSFSPEATMYIGWSHLAAAALFGILALAARRAKHPEYIRPRK